MRLSLFPKRYKKKNLLLMGASGGVSQAFLRYLSHHHDLLEKLFLWDKSDAIKTDAYIDHQALNYTFIHGELKLPEQEEEYITFLKKNKIDIVIDLTDMDSIPILEASNKAGVSYINTAMNDEEKYAYELVFDIYPRKEKLNKAAHILCSGMNPGVVNMWARHGIEKFGIPKEIIHFEYDTSTISLGWKAMMTWSLKEFLVECVRDPSGKMIGRDQVEKLEPNALKHRVDMRNILAPVMTFDEYPRGFTVMHEENVSLAQRYNVPSKFIYAFNMKTMEELVSLYDEQQNVFKKDLIHGDNVRHPLDGADNIGVLLKYEGKRVYYFNSAPNNSAIGTNGTYTQVVVGVYAALFVLLFDNLKYGAYFVEDLYDTHYRHYLFDNMRVEEYVFEKVNDQYKLAKYNPRLEVKRKDYTEHIYL
jgi:saccharopine dehydrogenase-like NADP-dependent oxidoreductase